jgi:predicted amidohydrolase YtcJ
MPGHADLVFTGASLEGAAPSIGQADSLAVRDGRILAVGTRAAVREYVGPRSEVVELSGETLLPGFGDAHIHPISGGMLDDQCNLHDLADADAYLRAVSEHAAANPERPWILGAGWSLDAFARGEPGRELLDRATGGRPAYLESNDGHVAWASSRALELAGIDATTRDPADGRIVRDADANPTGTLVDGAADLVAAHVPPPTHADRLRGLRSAQATLHALGITAWQDAHVEAEDLAAYRDAATAGWLTARVSAALWWERDGGLEQLDRLEEMRSSSSVGRLRAESVKLMLDGIIESRTAWLLDPYLGFGADRGAPFIDPALLPAAVTELDRRGFQAHFHAIGDAAVRLALDAVAVARLANGHKDTRPHVAHLELVHPDDVPRFAPLGVTANIQPYWAVNDRQMRDFRLPALGAVRAAWQFPFRSLGDAGARLAGGSDWTVTTADPLLEMEVAVRRAPPGDREREPLLPEQRLTVDEAVAAFTIGSAYANHLDGETGTLEVGKLADLVLLDRDLRSVGDRIGDAHVLATYVEGRQVRQPA